MATTTATFTLSVQENQAVAVDNPIPDITAGTIPSYINYVLPADTFGDPENEAVTLSYSISPDAPWLTFHSSNHTFNGLPLDNSVAGTYLISVHADDPWDDVGTTTDQFSFMVNQNYPPSLDNPMADPTSVVAHFPLVFTIPASTFSDPEGETITYSYEVTPAASWL